MSYPRMIQRWNMFSPSVLKRDKWLIVEAKLSNGSTVDPFTGKSPILDSVDYEFLWTDIDQFWRKYLTRIEKKTTQVKVGDELSVEFFKDEMRVKKIK